MTMKCFLNKLHQVHSRMIGKTNNIKVFGSKKANGSKQSANATYV